MQSILDTAEDITKEMHANKRHKRDTYGVQDIFSDKIKVDDINSYIAKLPLISKII